MKLTRRTILKGLGGATLGLPLLEGLQSKNAFAAGIDSGFAFFFRQANGVATERGSILGAEPERFYPRELGPLTPQSLQGRALDELTDVRDRILVVRNINMANYPYGDGHARGAIQALTARGPQVDLAGGDSEASGESIDHRIGLELNDGGRESLFLYAGRNSGWLGGACISHRGAGRRRAPLNDPWNTYQTIVGGQAGLSYEAALRLQNRSRSINDLVRPQLQTLLQNPRLSAGDLQRVQLHLDNVRDVEVQLSCRLDANRERELEGLAPGFNSTNGDDVLETARLHMDVATLAIACGYTRSVALQVGNGNDGATRFRDPDTGNLMENYHFLSHRRLSNDDTGTPIPNSDLMHHKVDRQFAQTFKYLVDRLSAYPMPDGSNLIDCGVAVWLNDLEAGPAHYYRGIPMVLAGSAGGFLKQGEQLEVGGGNAPNLNQLHNTLASAAGARQADGSFFDGFGDPANGGGLLEDIRA